jgi:hypothetical protein
MADQLPHFAKIEAGKQKAPEIPGLLFGPISLITSSKTIPYKQAISIQYFAFRIQT